MNNSCPGVYLDKSEVILTSNVNTMTLTIYASSSAALY